MKLILVFITALIFVQGNVLYSNEEILGYYYEIVKENCHDISMIRQEMDRINNGILKLFVERTAYVKWQRLKVTPH